MTVVVPPEETVASLLKDPADIQASPDVDAILVLVPV